MEICILNITVQRLQLFSNNCPNIVPSIYTYIYSSVPHDWCLETSVSKILTENVSLPIVYSYHKKAEAHLYSSESYIIWL